MGGRHMRAEATINGNVAIMVDVSGFWLDFDEAVDLRDRMTIAITDARNRKKKGRRF